MSLGEIINFANNFRCLKDTNARLQKRVSYGQPNCNSFMRSKTIPFSAEMFDVGHRCFNTLRKTPHNFLSRYKLSVLNVLFSLNLL